MIVASVNTVFFNANPLMKFDGYYVLTDIVEIPNLRTKAMIYCSYHLQRWLLGYRNLAQERILQDERHNRVFVIYSILAYLYMLTVIYSLTQVFGRFLAPYGLHDFGLALGIFVEGSFAMFPVVKVLVDAFSAGHKNLVREENVWLRITRWMVPLAVGIAIFCMVPSHYRVKQQAVLMAAHSDRAGIEVGGIVERVHVRTGQWVDAGDPLMTLRNADISTEAEIARLNQKIAMLRLQSYQANGRLRVEAQAPEAAMALESAGEALKRAELAQSKLVVRAPSAGYVAAADIERLEGRYLSPGFSGIRIADLRSFRLVIPLTEVQAELVEVGSRVSGHARAGGESIEGKVVVLPNRKANWDDYLPAMLSAFGGPAPYEVAAALDRAPPTFSVFLAEAEVSNPPPDAIEGLRVKVAIEGRKATYGQRIRRWFVSLWHARTM
jgi:putative peptide zinc metalloprotease protein